MLNALTVLDYETRLQVPKTAALFLQECEIKPIPNGCIPFFYGCITSSHTRNAHLQSG